MDREKVINGIQECNLNGGRVGNCPYKDVIAMLKELDRLLCKKQKDIDKLQADYSMLRHKFLEKTQIVRCRDCKWWDKKDDSPFGYCHACKHGYHTKNWEIGIYRLYKDDWFCADGEPKDHEDEDGEDDAR